MKKLTIIIAFIMSIMTVYSQGLDKQQQSMALIAARTATSDWIGLKPELSKALDNGLTVNQVKEELVHLYTYVGFPKSIMGLQTLLTVLDERKAKGISDNWGKEASPIKDKGNKYERGTKVLENLTKTKSSDAKPAYQQLSPEIDTFLKEHLFADIFERDVLTYQQRELATVSALIAMGNVEPMLQGHMGISLKQGLTETQLQEVITQLKSILPNKNINSAQAVLSQLTKNNITNTKHPVMNFNFKTKAALPPIPSPEVVVEKVYFNNRGMKLCGNLYSPKNKPEGKKFPALVVGHPFQGLKEQTSGLHAAMMAELGYVTLAFDASHYGESGGEPRQEEIPSDRVEDFSAALDFLTTLDFVDDEKIGLLGICASGGYGIANMQQETRFKAIATVSMFNMGRAFRENPMASPEILLQQAADERTKAAAGAPLLEIPPIPMEENENTPPLIKDFIAYYGSERGYMASNPYKFTITSVPRLINFFPFAQIETISPRPILIIVGEKAPSNFFSEEAYAKAVEPKELFVVPGATHCDLYDQLPYMQISLAKLDDFFSQYLGK